MRGRKTLVVGSGHSAANALLELAATRRNRTAHVASLGDARHRSCAGLSAAGTPTNCRRAANSARTSRALVESGRVELRPDFPFFALRERRGAIVVEGETANGLRRIGPVDRIIAATGQRPDLSITRELRLDLDPWLESAKALGPLIDPNLHSCGSVPPHGHRELSHPEPGFYMVGIKSYGRAPTFLLAHRL